VHARASHTYRHGKAAAEKGMSRRGAEERDLDGGLPAGARRLRVVPLGALVAHEHQPITWPMQRRQPKQWNILSIEEPAAKGEESAVAPQVCLVRG
jgi:hypothetical protein